MEICLAEVGRGEYDLHLCSAKGKDLWNHTLEFEKQVNECLMCEESLPLRHLDLYMLWKERNPREVALGKDTLERMQKPQKHIYQYLIVHDEFVRENYN